MTTFDTPAPVHLVLDLVAGDARIDATDRPQTTVQVRPSNPAAEADVRAAEQTRVEYADGRVVVRTPRQRGFGIFGRGGAVDVAVALPTGSRVEATASAATVRGTGVLGPCHIRTTSGDIHLDRTADADLDTTAGAVHVGRITGHARITTGSGEIRVQAVDGDAAVKNSNGDCRLGPVTGEVRVRTANGDVIVDRAGAAVDAATANGEIRLGEVAHGPVTARSGCGNVDIGIRAGTPVLLDLQTQRGHVDNHLDACPEPEHPADGVHVTARTSYGDILIRRR